MQILIEPVSSKDSVIVARTLLREYARYLNDSVGEEHICLENYEKELAMLPAPYDPPQGALLLAYVDDEPAGCIALKPLKPTRAVEHSEIACEMKRLWVRPRFRGLQLGHTLATALLEQGRQLGYTAMYLDTMPATMQAANRIYQSLGFTPVERYNNNPVLRQNAGCEDNSSPNVVFLRRPLN